MFDRIRNVPRRTAVIATLLLLANNVSVVANPSSQNPDKALLAHGTIAAAPELVKSLYELYNAEEAALIKMHEKKNNMASLPARQIESALGKIWRARRDAEHLKLMGEPAGYDLEIKFTPLAREYKRLAMSYKGTQPGSKLFASRKMQLQRETTKRQRFLTQMQEALQSGKLDAFEKQMETFGVKLNSDLALFSPTEAQIFSKSFDETMATGDAKLRPQRKAAYAEIALAKMKKELALAADFPAEASRIRDEIAASGTASLGTGKSGDASMAVAHLGDLWGYASAGLVRAGVLRCTFGGSENPSTLIEPMASATKKLTGTATRAIASVVDASVASVPSDRVVELYANLLKEISVIDRRGDGMALSAACQRALAKLAAKDPTLPNRVKSYQRATAEVLRWRALFATQRADLLQEKFPTAYRMMTEEKPVSSTNKPKLFGSVSSNPRVVAGEFFSGAASWNVAEAAADLVGKRISDQSAVRLSPTIKTAVVPFRFSHYMNVTVPIPAENEVAELKSALYVDDANPPLSMAAADAVSAAERNDYERVGGLVNRLDLEPLASRFIALPPVAYPLTRLGTMPPLSNGDSVVKQTCWRFNVTPSWVQHKYFVVFVPTQSQ